MRKEDNKMKEQYQNAEMDLVKFEAADVIATSDPYSHPNMGITTTWSKRPNETEPDWNTGW